jgi:hypothetical protein
MSKLRGAFSPHRTTLVLTHRGRSYRSISNFVDFTRNKTLGPKHASVFAWVDATEPIRMTSKFATSRWLTSIRKL